MEGQAGPQGRAFWRSWKFEGQVRGRSLITEQYGGREGRSLSLSLKNRGRRRTRKDWRGGRGAEH